MLSEKQVDTLTNTVCSIMPLGENDICAVFGYGSQTKSTYDEIADMSGVDVVWSKNFGPWWLSPLMWIAASKGGLARVDSREQAAKVLGKLGSLAMVELISCPGELYDQILAHVRRDKWRSRPSEIAAKVGDFFSFGFDGDSSDAEGGIYTWCAIGDNCSVELSHALAEYVEQQ